MVIRRGGAQGGRVTVRDIAALAQVSVATVSRTINNSGPVSPAVRSRVEAAIAGTGFRPSPAGRALTGRHDVLGVVVPGLHGPYFGQLVDGVDTVAGDRDLAVHILSTHMAESARDHVMDLAARVDGLAVIGTTVEAHDLVHLAAIVPTVVLAGPAPEGVASVRVENTAPVRELTRHLLVDHGRRHLVFVGHLSSPDGLERWQGFRVAHTQLGLEPAEPLQVDLGEGDGVLAAEMLLAAGARPDGVVCANDELALGVVVGLLGRGLTVPGDLAVTGFDDIAAARVLRPGLTTVSQPITDLGATAARVLLDPDRTATRTVLPTTVVLRGSCGCPEPARVAGPTSVIRPTGVIGPAPGHLSPL